MRKHSVMKMLAWLMVLGAVIGGLIVFFKKSEHGRTTICSMMISMIPIPVRGAATQSAAIQQFPKIRRTPVRKLTRKRIRNLHADERGVLSRKNTAV
jgi:hypothetical protein